MRLGELLKGIDCDVRGCSPGDIDKFVITSITADSREIRAGGRGGREGCLFIALKGEHADGHDFIGQAVEKGAVVVLTERDTGEVDAPRIIVDDARRALASLCRTFYRDPSKGLALIGITGTNGKTTTAFLVESILREAGLEAGLISTVMYRYGSKSLAAPYTTPDPTVLYRVLREMKDSDVTHCVMEVSSHALALGRTDGLSFSAAVFTNLTQDHLDFHGTMEDYFCSKARLFKELNAGRAVINMDDQWGERLAGELKGRVLGYSIGARRGADIFPLKYSLYEDRLEALVSTPAGAVKVNSCLVGEYNLGNILAAAGAGIALGIDAETIAKGVASLRSVTGRLERVETEGMPVDFRAYVDYAHTPDALERVLNALRRISKGRIITVFGCGGNRDRTKRPLMGEAAVRLSDITIVTSDNPRDEDPLEIIRDIETGLKGTKRVEPGAEPVDGSYIVIPDRERAINEAVRLARSGDTVLVAGKGHEDYQMVKGVKHPFSDFEVLKQAMSAFKENRALR